MKIWMGICLMWLMGRMAFAGYLSNLDYNISFDAITRSVDAVNELERGQLQAGRDYTNSLTYFIGRYESPEAFARGPLPQSVLVVPKPDVKLNFLEKKVYTLMAQRRLYPQVRVIYDLSDELRNNISRSGYIISHDQRADAQNTCFARKNFSQECIIREALEEDILIEIETSLEEYEIKASAQKVTDAVVRLLLKSNSSSVLNKENFISDGAHYWLSRQLPHDLVTTCLMRGKEFTNESLATDEHCREVISLELLDDLKMEEAMKRNVFDQIFGPFSLFKRMMSSLIEGPLSKGIYCFSSGKNGYACRSRKMRERINEWTHRSDFSSKDREDLIFAISTKWKKN